MSRSESPDFQGPPVGPASGQRDRQSHATSVRGDSALAKPYRDLVWLAYLTLPSNLGAQRVIVAHRLAAKALLRQENSRTQGRSGAIDWALVPVPGDDQDSSQQGGYDAEDGRTLAYERARREVLKRTLRYRPRPWVGSWGRIEVVPAVVRGDEQAFTGALEALPAPARAAYALTRLEGVAPDEARRVLREAGVPEPSLSLAMVDALEDEFGGSPAVEPRRPAADPTLARVYGRTRRRPWLIAVTIVLLVVIITIPYALGVYGPSAAVIPTAERLALLRATPGTWRTTTELDVRAWEPRGNLTGDDRLLARALRAWRGSVRPEAVYGASAAPPSATPQLLYAGSLDGGSVVLLRDPGRVVRYAESGGAKSLEIFPEPRPKPEGATPLKLAGARYLLPPWVTEVSAATLSRLGPRWKSVAVVGGVTAPIPQVESDGCWRGPVLRLRAPSVAHGLPYTMIDLGRLALANIHHEPPPPAEIDGYGPAEIDAHPSAFNAWAYLGCALPRPATEPQAASAWEFWAGALPESAKGRWLCARFTNTDGSSGVRTMLLVASRGRTTALPTGDRADTWDCSRLRRDLVAGTWWKAPSGRWWYLTAASRRITQISVAGPNLTDSSAAGVFKASAGPSGGTMPTQPITIKAITPEGGQAPSIQQTYEP